MNEYNDDEDLKKRLAYENRIALIVFVVAFFALCGLVMFYKSNAGGIDMSLPDIQTPFSPLSVIASPDPAINPYHEEGLPEATVAGAVTDIVPRDDRMPSGAVQTNYYARTEYYLQQEGTDCYFHQFLGPELPARYKKGDSVTVAYQPQAADACGSSRISE